MEYFRRLRYFQLPMSIGVKAAFWGVRTRLTEEVKTDPSGVSSAFRIARAKPAIGGREVQGRGSQTWPRSRLCDLLSGNSAERALHVRASYLMYPRFCEDSGRTCQRAREAFWCGGQAARFSGRSIVT